MFGKIKFHLLIPYDIDDEVTEQNVMTLNHIGVKVKHIEETDMVDNNDRIFEAVILVCVASKEVFEEVKKLYEVVSYHKGMPILCLET